MEKKEKLSDFVTVIDLVSVFFFFFSFAIFLNIELF